MPTRVSLQGRPEERRGHRVRREGDGVQRHDSRPPLHQGITAMMSHLTPRFHGVLTLVLLVVALLTGLIGIALIAIVPAILYGAMIAAGLPLLVYLSSAGSACAGGNDA
ncbi:MAG: hypothetical protein MZV64_42780 [Ignavibacteriales bacterium]|nr:hypothetical protein [Ignavibacteriales bacterium]